MTLAWSEIKLQECVNYSSNSWVSGQKNHHKQKSDWHKLCLIREMWESTAKAPHPDDAFDGIVEVLFPLGQEN